MDSLKNFYYSFHNPTNDDFQNKGYLSKEQFIKSGDQLTKTGWKWNPSKQYLSLQANSNNRIKDISQIKEIKNDEGWMESEIQLNEIDEQKIRQYTLSITYDEYYHTPRMWLSGVDINNNPLSPNQIFEDVMIEYQNQTVTVSMHPFINSNQVSIHPCKHSDVFKLFIDQANYNQHQILPHQALFIFLKFISSVIPTIQYDSTLDVNI